MAALAEEAADEAARLESLRVQAETQAAAQLAESQR